MAGRVTGPSSQEEAGAESVAETGVPPILRG